MKKICGTRQNLVKKEFCVVKQNSVRAKIFLTLLVIALAIPTTIRADAAPASVIVDGLLQRLEPSAVNIDGNVLIEAEQMFKLVGITRYDVSKPEVAVTFRRGLQNFAFFPDDSNARVDGVVVPMRAAAQLIDGKLYLPLRFVAVNAGVPPSWSEGLGTVSLDTRAADYSVLAASEKNTDYSDYKIYTLAEAVSKVYGESNDVKKLDESIETTEDALDDIELDYGNLDDLLLRHSKDWQRVDLQRQVQRLRDAIEKAEIGKDMLRLSAETQLASLARAIESAEYDILLLENKIALDELNLRNLELKLSLGYETESNVKLAKDTLAQSRLQLGQLKISLANSKLDLNKSLKVDPKALTRIVLPDNKPFMAPDVDKYAEDKARGDLNIRQLRIALGYAELVSDTHYFIDKSERERVDALGVKEKDTVVDADLRNAASAYHTAVSDLVFAARKASNQLKLLDEQYKAKELDRQKAVEQYKSTLVLYQTGGATMYAVLQTQAAILSAEAALKQNRITYSSALYTLEHTELLGSASVTSDEKK
ncbi:MAG: hypothetical protein LBK41_09690 [Clostridiales bacterium]|nr:hypothetical protein [Clostridiales bacterium]